MDQIAGLLGGIGAGMNSFAETYLRAKQLNQDEQYRNTQLGLLKTQQDANIKHQQFEESIQGPAAKVDLASKQAGLLTNPNVNYDATTGSVTPSELFKSSQQAGLLAAKNQAQMAQESADPNSETSKAIYNKLVGQYKAAKQDPSLIPQGMSANQYEKIYGSDAINTLKAEYQKEGAQVKANAIASNMQTRNETAKDNQATQASSIFDKDPTLVQYGKQRQAVQRGMHTLQNPPTDANGKPIVTSQLFHEVTNDFATAISGARAAAVSTQDKQELDSMQEKANNFWQKWTGKPQDAVPPEMVNYMINSLNRLDESYAKNASTRAHQIRSGRNYSFNPAANTAMDQKVNEFDQQAKPPQGQGLLGNQGGAPSPGPTPHPQDSAAVQWAKQNPKDPRAQKILQLNGAQ